MYQDFADAPKGNRVRAALHGLAGNVDQGHATVPDRQRQPNVSAYVLLLRRVSERHQPFLKSLFAPHLAAKMYVLKLPFRIT
jgi:hypothetical protein